jgi:2-iminobutanoate/2-iminopropanoate deaminase
MTDETPIYRPAVRAGDLVFVSGQIGLGPDGMAETLEGQISQVLVNLDKVLTDQGVERSQVVKATVFLTDMDDFPALNEQYREFFADPRPARSTIAVANLPFGARVEIEVVAYTG